MIKTVVYPNGIRFVHEHIGHAKATSVFIAVQAGPADETPEISGISHFIEHLLAGKDTLSRTAEQGDIEADENGLRTNAYTAPEYTAYYSKGLNEKFEKAAELLSDHLLNPAFLKESVDSERDVIKAEIQNNKNDYSRLLYFATKELFFKGHKLGNSSIGNNQTLDCITADVLRKYKNEHYIAPKTIVSVAGGVPFEEAERVLKKWFINKFKGEAVPQLLSQTQADIDFKREVHNQVQDTTQTFCMLVWPGMNMSHKDYRALSLFSIIWGGTQSSHLFREIRGKEGLVYSVYSSFNSDSEAGMFYVKLQTDPKKFPKVLKIIRNEIKKVLNKSITEKELEKAKTIAISNFVYHSDGPDTRAESNATNLIFRNRTFTLEENIEKYSSITLMEVREVAARVLSNPNFLVSTISKEPYNDALKILSE